MKRLCLLTTSILLALSLLATGCSNDDGDTPPVITPTSTSGAVQSATTNDSGQKTASLSTSGGTYAFTETSAQSASLVRAADTATVDETKSGTWTFTEKGKTSAKYSGTYKGDISQLAKAEVKLSLTVTQTANSKGQLVNAESVSFDLTATTSKFTATIPEVKEASEAKTEDKTDETTEEPVAPISEENTLPKYEIGSTVTFENGKYYVVSNTIDSSTRTARTADDVAEMVKQIAVSRSVTLATEYFGEHILLMRVAGKVQVPQGETEKYITAYNSVTKDLPNGADILDYFSEQASSENTKVTYQDNYKVLNKAGKQIGMISNHWTSDQKNYENNKTLFNLIEDFSPEIIRRAVPEQYKAWKWIESLNCDYYVTDIKMYEDGKTKSEQKPYALYSCENTGIKKQLDIKGSAVVKNDWNSDNSWKKNTFALVACYGNTLLSTGIKVQVERKNNSYSYSIKGSGEPAYSFGSSITFTFDENKTYSAENFSISSDANGLYSSDANLTYNESALSVPIDFILNDDGSVSFGTKFYAWADAWRDYIVSSHEDAKVYNEN